MWHCFEIRTAERRERTNSPAHSQQYSSLVSTSRRSIERVEAVRLSKRPHSLRLGGNRSLSSLIVSQPIKCFFSLSLSLALKNNLLIIIFHIYSSLSVLSVGATLGLVGREDDEEESNGGVSGGTSSRSSFIPSRHFPFFSPRLASLSGIFFPPLSTSLSLAFSLLFSTSLCFSLFDRRYFLNGVSLPMLCQKVVLRLGSASMKTCCWGRAEGSEGCFCRSRKS